MAVGAQRAAVDPGIGHGVDDLVAVAAQHCRRHRSTGDTYQQDVVQAHAVETVFQGQHALDLMGADHGVKEVRYGQRLLPGSGILPAEIVGNRKNAAQVVGGMAPFGGQPGVVEVQPAHHGADVERRLHRVQPVVRARHPRPVRHFRPRHHRPQQPGAGRELQRQHAAGQCIQKAVERGAARFLTGGRPAQYVIGDILQQRIGRRPPGIPYTHVRHL